MSDKCDACTNEQNAMLDEDDRRLGELQDKLDVSENALRVAVNELTNISKSDIDLVVQSLSTTVLKRIKAIKNGTSY